MGKANLNKLQKRNALFQTAFDLFTNKGFAKTTISDIVNQAGLAKGTFYLYFKDKYDLRDKLIISQTSQLFGRAHEAMAQHKNLSFEDQIITFADYIIGEFEKNPPLLRFISKNLSWGIFKNAFERQIPEESQELLDYCISQMAECGIECKQPELMLFTIIELVGSTAHSCILYHEPVQMDMYLPYLHETIRDIFERYTSKAAE
ncbi:MAG: TetR/AcrR family transcriptional regulator [Lachnospiraceae bacterium]|nr:TetR/AcrR family transcriptional regulator [Lachnospiraceae bacterium]